MDNSMPVQLEVIEPSTSLEKICVGNSYFTDDTWDVRPFVSAKFIQENEKYIRFSFIKSDDMRNTVKHYAYYKLGKMKAKTVAHNINSSLHNFIKYCTLSGIVSFEEMDLDDYLDFNIWLKLEKKVSVGTGFKTCHIVEEIIRVGQIKGWKVPQFNIPKSQSSFQLWYKKRSLTEKNKTKPIPEKVFDQILYHALNDEKMVLTKAGIIIQSQTGLRISEVLSIKEGCVKTTADGYDYMEVLLGKTEKGEPILHKVFINDVVKNTIYELELATESLRRKSGLKELFLQQYGENISVVKSKSWPDRRLSLFIKRWDIRGEDGELYPLKSHQFRATFVRELIKRKVPLAMIMKQYSHVSIEMTAHYLTLQEDEVKEIYADMILNPEVRIAGLRANEIKEKLGIMFRGKTIGEIDEIISNLAKSMSFNTLPTGVCLYDFRRGNCSDGDGCFFYNCPNYITEVQFYPILKAELDMMEKEMERLNALGQRPAYQVQAVKHKYLKPLVESLEAQINGK